MILRHQGRRSAASCASRAPGRGSTANPAYPLASLSSGGVQVSTPRAWGLCPVLPPGGVLPRFVSLLRRGPEHGPFSRCLRYPQPSSFLPTHRTPYATRAFVCPPAGQGHRAEAAPPPAPPRPSAGTLAAAVGGRTVLDLARRAPVRPLRAANAPRPYHRAAWTLPFRGGSVRRRAPAPPRPSQRILVPLAAPLRGLRVRGCAA